MTLLNHDNIMPLLGAYIGDDSHHLVTPFMSMNCDGLGWVWFGLGWVAWHFANLG
jgi:hypothetical protein